MSVTAPKPSRRFVRAAVGEHADLKRHRARLEAKRQGLLDDLAQVEEAMAAVDGQLTVITQLLKRHDVPVEQTSDPAESPGENEDRDTRSIRHTLRGPAIRDTAVRVLLGQPEYIEAIHYRRWFELLSAAGYSIAGKKPEAVFLTQITRSPVVRKRGAPGVYELDRQAPLRLRQGLERLRSELRELSASSPTDAEMASVRARRHDLDVAISQQERALEEALRVLSRDVEQAEPARISAVADG